MPEKASKAVPHTSLSKAALAGCDWFVRSQIVQQPPNWDANHGRFIYNRHVPTGVSTMGLVWTQARAVMCLLAAYERTGKRVYLDCAERGIGYALSLQDMDRRRPLTYGAFHEETVFSPFSYPRDAIEMADALLQWHRATGDSEALYRAELFFDWFRRNALTSYPKFGFWAKASVRFDAAPVADRLNRPVACEMGCITILTHAYAATGRARYRTWALKMAESTLNNFFPSADGPLAEPPKGKDSHHTGRDGIIYNDDGGTVGLLNAFELSGQARFLDAAVRTADFYCASDRPVPIVSGLGSIANLLLETYATTENEKYRTHALRYLRRLRDCQVKTGPASVRGAFRGEDEGGAGYVKGADNLDLVTTRVTAYAVLALFKAEGAVWPRGYSTRW